MKFARQLLLILVKFCVTFARARLEATPPPEFDLAEEASIFEQVVATFEWL